MDADLTASMFTRMFYQEGIGLRYFKKFSDERSVFGGRIIVWKVDWEGKEKTVIEVPEPKEEVIESEKEINVTDEKVNNKSQIEEEDELEDIEGNETEETENNVTEIVEEVNKSENVS